MALPTSVNTIARVAGCFLLAVLLPVTPVRALEALTDAQMQHVAGQDGLSISLDGDIAAQSLQWQVDSAAPTYANALVSGPVAVQQVGISPNLLRTTIDAGASAGDAYIAVDAHMDRARIAMDSLTLESDPGRSFGRWVLYTPLSFQLVNRGVLFNDGSDNDASLYLGIESARWFYQQNWYYHANLTLDNLDFVWDMPSGSVGMQGDALRIAGDTDFRLNFDLLYKFHPDQDLETVTANDKPMINFGWQGRLYDAEVLVRSGGAWDGSEIGGAYDQSARTEGLNLGLRWNYKKDQGDAVTADDLSWLVGRAGGNHMLLEFGDWRNLQDAAGVRVPWGFDFPSITIDAVAAGGAGPGGICWGAGTHGSGCAGAGGQLLDLEIGHIDGFDGSINRTDGGALLHLIRDGNLLAYSSRVTASADGMAPESWNWGLIYTLANINTNIALYPGGSESDPGGGSRNQGMMADVLISTQSLDGNVQGFNWEKGSHFMIADTCSALSAACPRGEINMGIGFLGSSFLLGADDMRIWLKNTWSGTAAPNNWDGGIDLMSPRARLQLSGILGGVKLPTGTDRADIASVDMNLEGLLNVRLSPPPDGENFLAYSAGVRLYPLANNSAMQLASGNGSYWSIAEPGRPEVALRFTNMTGDFALAEGRLEVMARNEKGQGEPPMLTLENKILVGASAAGRLADATNGIALPGGGPAGKVLQSDVFFGDNALGRVVIPAATLKSSISLLPK